VHVQEDMMSVIAVFS